MADNKPGYELTNNPHGLITFGPHEKGEGSDLTIATKGGYYLNTNENGNSIQVTPEKNDEVCGHRLDPNVSGLIAKSLVAKQGDIHIIAEQGNIHLKAKNLFIETQGDSPNGNVNINANGSVTVVSGERIYLGGAKVCLRAQAAFDIVTSGFVKVLGTIKQTPRLSPISFLNPAAALESILQELANTCK